jgi:predicted transposase YdaD
MAAIMAGLRFGVELVHRLFRREIMMQSVIYREIFQEGEQIGEQIGEQRGIQIGEQRGIQIGEQRGVQIGEQRGELHGRLAVVERQLKRRCGTLTAELREQVRSLALPELDQLSEAVLDFNSAADLTRWLEQLHR